MKKIIVLCLLLLCFQWSQAQKTNNHKWDFNDLEGWKYGHQDNNPANQCEIKNGILKIFTRAKSRDRKKICTVDKIYNTSVNFYRKIKS